MSRRLPPGLVAFRSGKQRRISVSTGDDAPVEFFIARPLVAELASLESEKERLLHPSHKDLRVGAKVVVNRGRAGFFSANQ
jgi:hypothetical protein